MAGCAEAEEVQAAARSSHSQGQGPLGPTLSSPAHFLSGSPLAEERGGAHAQTHPAPLHHPTRPGCQSLPKALARNQKQPRPSLPEHHGQGARLTWKEATPSFTLRVTQGNTTPHPSCLNLPKCEMGIMVNSAVGPDVIIKVQVVTWVMSIPKRKTNLCHRVPHVARGLAPPKAPAPLQKSQHGLPDGAQRGGSFSPTQPRASAHTGRQPSQTSNGSVRPIRAGERLSPAPDETPDPNQAHPRSLPLPGALGVPTGTAVRENARELEGRWETAIPNCPRLVQLKLRWVGGGGVGRGCPGQRVPTASRSPWLLAGKGEEEIGG